MVTAKSKVIILITALVVAGAWYSYIQLGYRQAQERGVVVNADHLNTLTSVPSANTFSVPEVKFLPDGKADVRGAIEYKVSFGSPSGPSISRIVFAPYDVKPGDTQDIYVIGNYEKGIDQVTANIKTDSGLEDVPLSLTQGDSKNGLWRGSWRVHDVHDGYYPVLFTVGGKDGTSRGTTVTYLVGAQDGVSRARAGTHVAGAKHGGSRATTARYWIGLLSSLLGEPAFAAFGSEQCGIPMTGAATISGACSIGSNDGVVNGNITMSTGSSISLAANVTFGFTSGYSISVCSNCSISIASGAKLVKAPASNFWVEDKDADNYWDAQAFQSSSPGAGWKARTTAGLIGGGDCYDLNANAHPGQTSFFTTNRGDGSFDYNCDGTQESQQGTAANTCVPNDTCGQGCTVAGSEGWVSDPGCGNSGSWQQCAQNASECLSPGDPCGGLVAPISVQESCR
jgi:hypothetical protein